MTQVASSSKKVRQRRRVQERALALACTAMVGAAILGRLASPQGGPSTDADDTGIGTPVRAQQARAPIADHAWLLDPTPILRTDTTSLAAQPLAAALRPSQPDAPAAAPVARALMSRSEAGTRIAPAEIAAAKTAPLQLLALQTVPVPMRRPLDLVTQRETPRLAARSITPRAGRPDAEAEKSFFETVFGAQPEPAQALAYAPMESKGIDTGSRRLTDPSPAARAEGATAVYDITARTVTLPSGERLEAHSGLGPAMDNPRYVHLRMRGSTPPGIYDLTEREALFHGVRAIRLSPVGGSAAIHGRDGILAHTYMLGPKGASNGCVSFRDYNRFLQAYLRGEVRRLVVVAGNGGDSLPAIVGRTFKRFAGAD